MEIEIGLLEECLKEIKKDPFTVAAIIDEISIGNNFLARVKSLEKKLTNRQETIEAPRFFNKKAIIKIGAYDENLISGEDWDLAIRVKKLGKISRVKKHIFHYEKGSYLADIKKKYYYARHISKYANKHPLEFKKQSGRKRFTNLFKNPRIIMENPFEFTGLLVLKTLQYLAYVTTQPKLLLKNER